MEETLDKMTAHKMAVDKMTAHKMTADKSKMTSDRMT
jgi:hypothetical protein